VAADLALVHAGVRVDAVVGEAFEVDLTGRDGAVAHGRGRLGGEGAGQLVVFQGRHVDVEVDAVQEGPADALAAAEDLARRAATQPARVGVVPARTPVSRTAQTS